MSSFHRTLRVLAPLALLAFAAVVAAAQIPRTDAVGGLAYHDAAQHARQLYSGGDFASAAALLDSALALNATDGSLWYLFARSHQRLGNTPAAITAFRRSLAAGHQLTSNAHYHLARLYAGAGNRDSALVSLERALASRWEDRPAIAEDTAFRALRGDPRFARIAGLPLTPWRSRVEGWQHDIDYLVEEAKRLHVAPARPAFSPAFDAAAAELRRSVARLTDDEVLRGVEHLMLMLGDGHTGIYGPGPDTKLAFSGGSLPLQLRPFSDGVFVIDAIAGSKQWIGAEVVAFGDVSAATAIARLPERVKGDNAFTPLWLGAQYVLPSAQYLLGIGATRDPARVVLSLRTQDGRSHRAEFQTGDHIFTFDRKLRAPDGVAAPLFLSRVNENYWFTARPDDALMYFQFNQVRDMSPGASIAEFADSLRLALVRADVTTLVVDVRHNNGGNNTLFRPLLRTLVWWEIDNPTHRLFVITDRNTFSAAQNFINEVERQTNAVFVGEPSSSSPNFTGEETNLVLPFSRVRGSISSLYWQDSDSGDERPFIVPGIPVGMTSRDYFSGRDPALAAVLLACCGVITEALPAQPPPRDSVQERAVVYRVGDVEIAATLLSPARTRPTTAVVIVHGSGSSTRDNAWTTAYAQALAQRGIIVLYPDKRGSGQSSGDWRTSSVQDLAADVRAGLAFLRSQPGGDSIALGIIGFSQGGYVASVVAAEDAAVSFTAVISGGTATLANQIVDELVLEAEHGNQRLSEAAVERLRRLYGMLFEAARDRPRHWTAYIRAVAEAKDQGGPLAYALRTIPLDSTHWAVAYLASMGDFDPMAYWNRATSPVFFVFGGADTQVRIDDSTERLRASPARNHFTIITLGDNGHALFRDDVTAFLVEWFRMRGKDR